MSSAGAGSVAAARQQLLRLGVGEAAAHHLAIGGKQAVVVEGRTQDAEAAVEVRKIVGGVHAGAAEEPDLLDELAGRPGGGADPAQQDGKHQSSN